MIATFTDFGLEGPYLGQVRAVLQQLAPGIPVVDLFTDLPAFQVQAAAYLIPAYSRYLPPASVCLCVVDPGVGGDRAAIAVQADGRWYVAPDNGVLSMVVRHAAVAKSYAIDWRPEKMSASFHGRDLFAPACAKLALGDERFLSKLSDQDMLCPDWPDDLAQIIYIDHYGNAVTGLRAEALAQDDEIDVSGRRCPFRRVFTEADVNQVFWYPNANGLVELAVRQSSAVGLLTAGVGQSLRVIKR